MRIKVRVKDAEKIVYVYGQSYKFSPESNTIHEFLFFPVEKPAFVHGRQLSKEQQKIFNQIKRKIVKQIIQNAEQFFSNTKPVRETATG